MLVKMSIASEILFIPDKPHKCFVAYILIREKNHMMLLKEAKISRLIGHVG